MIRCTALAVVCGAILAIFKGLMPEPVWWVFAAMMTTTLMAVAWDVAWAEWR